MLSTVPECATKWSISSRNVHRSSTLSDIASIYQDQLKFLLFPISLTKELIQNTLKHGTIFC